MQRAPAGPKAGSRCLCSLTLRLYCTGGEECDSCCLGRNEMSFCELHTGGRNFGLAEATRPHSTARHCHGRDDDKEKDLKSEGSTRTRNYNVCHIKSQRAVVSSPQAGCQRLARSPFESSRSDAPSASALRRRFVASRCFDLGCYFSPGPGFDDQRLHSS